MTDAKTVERVRQTGSPVWGMTVGGEIAHDLIWKRERELLTFLITCLKYFSCIRDRLKGTPQ